MPGPINCRPILHQQHHCLRLQAGARLLPMRGQQGFKSHFRFIEQSVHRFEVFPSLVVFGPPSLRIADQRTGSLDRSSSAPPIPQQRWSKGLFGPTFRGTTTASVLSPTPFSSSLSRDVGEKTAL
jgi:hypothetical protein